MADLLPRLRVTFGEVKRLPADGFDARRFRSAGLVSDWHEAEIGPAVAGRYRNRLWVVAEAGLDELDQRTPRRRVRGRRFFGLLVAVELRRDEGWPAVLLLRQRGAVTAALRRWSPPVRGLDPAVAGGVLAERYEAWRDGSAAAGELLRGEAGGLLARLAEAIGEPAPFALTGTELLVALPRLLPALRVEAKGDETELAAAAGRLGEVLGVARRLIDVLEGPELGSH